jgi:hypothetical protein
MVGRSALVLPDGSTVPLTSINGSKSAIAQTPAGWLVTGGDSVESRGVWLVKPDGGTQRQFTSYGSPAVAPDGLHVAWREGHTLFYGQLNPAGTATVQASSPVSTRHYPIVVGTDSVVLGYSDTGAGIGHWDVWFPGRGNYVDTSSATTLVTAVFKTALADGSYLGLVYKTPGTKELCVAVLDPDADLAPTKRACGLPIVSDVGAVSPDRKWLAVIVPADNTYNIGIADLTTVFTKPTIAHTFVGEYGDFAWEDGATLLAVGPDRVVTHYAVGSWTATPDSRPGITPTSTVNFLPRVGGSGHG